MKLSEKNISLKEMEKNIEKLNPKEQLMLMGKIIQLLEKSSLVTKKELDWKELYGLGKGLWNGLDAQEYVNHLREERL